MKKTELFEDDLQDLARYAKAFSHPARLAILKYISRSKCCISGDISGEMPLSRTTISQHLKELKNLGIIEGEIEGVKINYCICEDVLAEVKKKFESFFIHTGKGMFRKKNCCR